MTQIEHKSPSTAQKLYRGVVIGCSMLPIISMVLIAGIVFVLMLYVFGAFVVVAFS